MFPSPLFSGSSVVEKISQFGYPVATVRELLRGVAAVAVQWIVGSNE
jgi:hypothetical protein